MRCLQFTKCGDSAPAGGSNHSQAPGPAIKPPLVSLAVLPRLLGCMAEINVFSFKILNVKHYVSPLALIFVLFLFSCFLIL